MQTKLVILDRDGTINQDRDDYVKSADEWVPLPGALEAIARLNHAGWHVVVASNQRHAHQDAQALGGCRWAH
jgi:D-glycero-D-manno-heptose 1,7-bisphosphate phosphatase